MIRQFPDTLTAQYPARSPLSGCSPKPGILMSPGPAASSRRARTRSTLAVNAGGTRLGSPFSNKRSRPLVTKATNHARMCNPITGQFTTEATDDLVCPATATAPSTCVGADSQQCRTHGCQQRGRELLQPYHPRGGIQPPDAGAVKNSRLRARRRRFQRGGGPRALGKTVSKDRFDGSRRHRDLLTARSRSAAVVLRPLVCTC